MKNILFDVDGVLIHGYHARPEHRHCWDATLEQDFGLSRQDFKTTFISGPFKNEVLIGKKDLNTALQETLPEIGYTGPIQDFINYWLQKDSKVNQQLYALVKRLKEQGEFRLYLATNQEHERAGYLMNTLGFSQYFEDIFYSARIGCQKPEKPNSQLF